MLTIKNEHANEKESDLFFQSLANVKEVVVAGNYGGGNLGDEAMLDVLAALFAAKLPGLKIVVPSRRPDVLQRLHPSPIVLPIGVMRGALRAFLSEMLIIGGGTIFSSLSGFGIWAIVSIAILRKILLRKKYYFYGIGYSKSTSKILSAMSRIAFHFADGIYVRDSLSYSYLSGQIKHGRLFLLPELALNLKESDNLPPETVNILRKGDGPSIGLSLMYIASSPSNEFNENVLDSVKELIENVYSKYNAKFYFLTFQPRVIDYSKEWRSDSEIGKTIINRLSEQIRSNCYVLEYYPPSDTLRIMREFDSVISMRYHCLVFAHMQKKPYVAISFDDKHSAFVKDYGGELLDIREISPHTLREKWENVNSS